MLHQATIRHLGFLAMLIFTLACQRNTQWEGQKPIQIVPTTTLPIQLQYRGTFDLGNGLMVSNEFQGARLNGIVRNNDTLITALITAENTPINESPWYAFKMWSSTPQQITLKLTYQEGAHHRYYPKISDDAKNWTPIAGENYFEGPIGNSEGEGRPLPDYAMFRLDISPDTLWVSAQELITSSHNTAWVQKLAEKPFISTTEIGQSRAGKPLHLLKIGNADDQNMIMVLTRQHPPEVTGHIAMMAFVEAIAGDTETARLFRDQFNTYVVPMVNPDGVDQGHWRHNTGGIDLNRDWANVNQPEVKAIQDFMQSKVTNGGKFYFAVDFHSTWEDIYYTINPELKGNKPGLVPAMIEEMAKAIPGLNPNIRPGDTRRTMINSSRYFFFTYGAESLTYEFGDNTPRDLVRQKGEVSAMKLMSLLLK